MTVYRAEPLDPATPEGAAAEDALNEVLGGVLRRLDREAREAELRRPDPLSASPITA